MNRSKLVLPIIYGMTTLSGAAALVYEVVWFRSLSLVFGGAHLAVATTVAVFMLGLAAGSWAAERWLPRAGNLLRCYGLLEVGMAAFAGIFLLLVSWYPTIYVAAARLAPESPGYLTLVRVLFSLVAMIGSTLLMGATLPVLTALTARGINLVGRQLSYLYGLNTLGAVCGAGLAGFLLLGSLPVSQISFLGMAVNLGIGGFCLLLACRRRESSAGMTAAAGPQATDSSRAETSAPSADSRMSRWILLGAGVSGFCALGYEVLWTRVLILFLDGSTYSFTTVLMAFLLGIGLGGLAYGLCARLFFVRDGRQGVGTTVLGFGLTQLLIGVFTLLAMGLIPRLPGYSLELVRLYAGLTGDLFQVRQLANFTLALTVLLPPALLMGLAIPLAGKIHAHYTKETGRAVGALIACNTIGAILGALASGFVLIQLLGIERALTWLVALNLAGGTFFLLNRRQELRRPAIAVGVMAAGLLALLIAGKRLPGFWDQKFLATYTPNFAPYFADEARQRERLAQRELLFYGEGREATVSSVLEKSSGIIAFTTNGKVEASTRLDDVQNQYMLGHLPMLLHRNPRNVLVVGLGTGMTLGAVTVHPGLERVTVAEIEPKVFAVARTFGEWNHRAVDNPKVKAVINDGRNFLLTTSETFDVITADPIHPVMRGAGYLYTDEYFRLAAGHLAPGGIICQWLPLYQLSPDHVRSVVATMARNFKYVTVWLTLVDAQIVASNEPLVIDQEQVMRRMTAPGVADDLRFCGMGTSDALLTYFVMGPAQVERYIAGATINTDENVYLEFSAPVQFTDNTLQARNVGALSAYRENVANYLVALVAARGETARQQRWRSVQEGQLMADRAQRWYLKDSIGEAELVQIREAMSVLPRLGRWALLQKLINDPQNY